MLKEQLTLDLFESTNKKALDWLKDNKKLGTQTENVLRALFLAGDDGLTDEEGSELIGIKQTSWIARRHDLIKKYPDLLFSDTYRLGSSNLMNRIWRVNVNATRTRM